jgi:hypothetical protein
MSNAIITVENLGKRYSLRHQTGERYTALRDVITDKAKSLFRRNSRKASRVNGPPQRLNSSTSPAFARSGAAGNFFFQLLRMSAFESPAVASHPLRQRFSPSCRALRAGSSFLEDPYCPLRGQ